MAAKTLLVKDNGVAVKVYAELPPKAVSPDLYKPVAAKPVKDMLGGFKDGYLLKQLQENGVAILGRRNTGKKALRAIVQANAHKPSAPTQPSAQVAAPQPSNGKRQASPAQQAALAKGRATRDANRKAKQQKSKPATQDAVLVLKDEIRAAREAGDFEMVEILVDRLMAL